MPELLFDRFPEFFRAVRGHEPFPWQADLTARLIGGRFPDVIDVATGLGKTSVIACWAYALAAHAFSRDGRDIPLRLCFVVDRRLVVDGAYQEAQALADALASATSGAGVVADVAMALQSLHGADDIPLRAVRMRGGITWESRWLARPDQAAVVVGTIDQFGSRLLFRGYGVSPSMRPIDAALVGVDSWLVVDEAHIAEPLVQTVGRVKTHQEREGLVAVRRLRMTRMSATLDEDGEVFRADVEEQARSTRFPSAAKEAAKRLGASKPTALLHLAHLDAVGAQGWANKARQLGQAMADIALTVDGDARVIGVVANTVATARAAHHQLLSKHEDAILLIGRVRGFERDRLLEEWVPKISVGAPRDLQSRLFVVATQTIEVGANIDLDALVTECAPLRALIQRFGRVNRTGDRSVHRSAIVHAGFAHDDDPVYGEATLKTWQMLEVREDSAMVDQKGLGSTWPERTLDFGLRSVAELIRDAPSDVASRPPFVPVALGAHMERWVATNPAPFPDQSVAPFLHGVDRDVPEVSVGWRAAPPVDPDSLTCWGQWLDLVPPVEWEFVSVPIWETRALIAGEESETPMSDQEGTLSYPEPEASRLANWDLLGVVYRGRGADPSAVRAPGDVEPGDRVVLRSDIGGHDAWGWTGTRAGPGDAPIPDVGDVAPTRRRGVLRLSRAVIGTWVPVDGGELDEAFAGLDPDDLASVASTLQALSQDGLPIPLDGLVRRAAGWRAFAAELSPDARPVVLLVAPSAMGRSDDTASDEDEASTSQSARQVSISQHGRQVGATAREFAERLGLPDELLAAVEQAGRCHDLGKAEPRFQIMLHDGDELAALAAAEPLAKSGRASWDPVARRARELAGLPAGFRHEAVSARLFDELVAADPALAGAVDAELVRHLVVSHHGKGRPLLPALLDPGAPKVRVVMEDVEVAVDGALAQVDWAQPARFEALNERYGYWGLALLECLVRLADMWCSERGR